MPFGARNDDGWRLCYRKGKSIYYVKENPPVGPEIVIEFPSQARAKACADELNEHWAPYWKTVKKGGNPDPEIFWKYIDILVKHNGISAEDAQELNNAIQRLQ